MNIKRKLGAIILAAGRGKRMKLKDANKTSLLLNGKPLISYPVELFEKMKIDPIIIVVGHAKESVQSALRKSKVVFAEQRRRLGTGHAVKSALPYLNQEISDVLVINGDDSYIYTEDLLNKLIVKHSKNNPAVTLMTIQYDNPTGIGRIIRNNQNEVIDIVEEKDATANQKKIKEININCFVFRVDFLRKYLNKIPKSPVTGEYYLPALIKLAFDHGEKIETLDGGHLPWRGINTKEELDKAQELLITLRI